jgi:hypothetical protein
MAKESYDQGRQSLSYYPDFWVRLEERMAFIQDRFKPDFYIDPDLFFIRDNFIRTVAQNFRQTPSDHFSTSGWGPNIDQFAHVSAVLSISWAEWINMDPIVQRALFDNVNDRIEAQNKAEKQSSKDLEMKLQSLSESKTNPLDNIRSWNNR